MKVERYREAGKKTPKPKIPQQTNKKIQTTTKQKNTKSRSEVTKSLTFYVFCWQRRSENGKWARKTEEGGTSAVIANDFGNRRNEQSQRPLVHSTSFMKDKLWSTKLHSKLI